VIVYDEQNERRNCVVSFLQGLGAQIQNWGESCDLSILTDHPPLDRSLSPINIIVGDSYIAEAPDLPLPLPLPIRWNLLREKLRQAMGLFPQEANALPCENCQKLNMSILVVDDNAVNRKVASLMLQKLGCTYVLASGGSEALDLLPKHTFDACLMDCQMLGMDGFLPKPIVLQSLRDTLHRWK